MSQTLQKLRSMSSLELAKELTRQKNLYASEQSQLKEKLDEVTTLTPTGRAGGLLDMNKIISPFVLSCEGIELANEAINSSFARLSMDASFVVTRFAPFVYEVLPDNQGVKFVDLEKDQMYGLKVQIIDPSSQRNFQTDPVQIAHFGTPNKQVGLIACHLIKPASAMEFKFENNTGKRLFVGMLMIGYKARLE